MKLFVANWKMHKTRGEARAFADDLAASRRSGARRRELVVAPPFTALDAARDERGRWTLACQNVAAQAEGAFTGEVSAAMAADAGCRYAIVGHSERRRLFGEDDAVLARKLARCREAGLTPIYCVGETAQERDAGLTATTLVRQLDALAADPAGLAARGGLRARLGDRDRPRRRARGRRGGPRPHRRAPVRAARTCASSTAGSVTAENAVELLGAAGVDGFLIGGASLSAAWRFAAIARA